MRSKGLIGMVIVVVVGMVTYLLADVIGTTAAGSSSAFKAWRGHNISTFFFIWLSVTVVVAVPTLWAVGRKLVASAAASEESAAAARGVGRIAVQALRGRTEAVDKLVTLLKDPSPAVRRQAARALVLLDDGDVNPTLFKVVRYWPVQDKLALIDTLVATHDLRSLKLLRVLAGDRSQLVASKATAVLPLIGRVERGITDPNDRSPRRRNPLNVEKGPRVKGPSGGARAARRTPGATPVRRVKAASEPTQRAKSAASASTVVDGPSVPAEPPKGPAPRA